MPIAASMNAATAKAVSRPFVRRLVASDRDTASSIVRTSYSGTSGSTDATCALTVERSVVGGTAPRTTRYIVQGVRCAYGSYTCRFGVSARLAWRTLGTTPTTVIQRVDDVSPMCAIRLPTAVPFGQYRRANVS